MKKLFFISFFAILLLPSMLNAQLRLPSLISDGMVLQRNAENVIFGWAAPKEMIHITFLDSSYYTRANEIGEWGLYLYNLQAGGPHEMKISTDTTIIIKDILIGDVWVCSGQSQMDMDMNRVRPLYEEEIRNAGNPDIHYFEVPGVYNFEGPQDDYPRGKWESISQENISGVSAIAYFFAKEIHEEYGIPVGIIRSSMGGSPIESWMSEDALREFPDKFEEAQKFKDPDLISKIRESDQKRINAWYSELNRKDLAYNSSDLPWYSQDKDVSNWDTMKIPGYWSDEKPGRINGVVWFRKDIILSPEMAGKPAKLLLGRIVDADSVFVNGGFVGTIAYQYPPRRYEIPCDVLKEGKNTIVIRVINTSGRGGFIPDKPYELIVGESKIDLKGEWHYKVGAEMEALRGQTFIRWKPTGLYNGMIAPLTKHTIKGVIWYQGESNTSRPYEYAELFPRMIESWRKSWRQDSFPFLFVQLHNYMKSYEHPTESDWALLRESQTEALKLPGTAMAVAIDLGVWNDIHPLNKKDVAERLALAARKTAYGEDELVYSGPMYQSMKRKGKRIILDFSHTGSGLKAKGGGKLKRFWIAGNDREFVKAKARIRKNKVIVWSPEVKNPIAVRYAWSDNPEGANLYNREGLPAAPFRTDDWKPSR